MNHAQSTRSLLGYGAGLLSLCLGATLIFFTLQPADDSLQGFQPEEPQARKVVRVQPAPPASDVRADVSLPVANTPAPKASLEEKVEDEDATTVTVVEAGKIRLNEEQADLLRGRGAAWGQDNTEADAVLRSIPKEAFTSDW